MFPPLSPVRTADARTDLAHPSTPSPRGSTPGETPFRVKTTQGARIGGHSREALGAQKRQSLPP
eukprot:scaffold18977_cov31-Tisochrysis_lutea.AAC.2